MERVGFHHLHMPLYILVTFTEYPYLVKEHLLNIPWNRFFIAYLV